MNTLILDTETTGVPDCKGLRFSEFPDYADLKKYDFARVIQISYIKTDKKYKYISDSDIIIKSDYDITNSEFHGITNEISQLKGIPFIEFTKKFMEDLKDCDTIIAHNIKFDINVLRSEFYRHSCFDVVSMLNTKKYICTMNYTKRLVGIPARSGIGFKNPSLKELYYFATGEVMENHHTCSFDTSNLLCIIRKLYQSGDFNV